MEIEYLNELPDGIDFNDRRNNTTAKIREWEATGNEVLKLICKTQQEKRNTVAVAKAYIKKNSKDFTVFLEKHSYNIYLVRS